MINTQEAPIFLDEESDVRHMSIYQLQGWIEQKVRESVQQSLNPLIDEILPKAIQQYRGSIFQNF